jgi:hypothetical protein
VTALGAAGTTTTEDAGKIPVLALRGHARARSITWRALQQRRLLEQRLLQVSDLPLPTCAAHRFPHCAPITRRVRTARGHLCSDYKDALSCLGVSGCGWSVGAVRRHATPATICDTKRSAGLCGRRFSGRLYLCNFACLSASRAIACMTRYRAVGPAIVLRGSVLQLQHQREHALPGGCVRPCCSRVA